MPFYEFRCSDCDHLFEEFFPKIPKDGETLEVECPECKSKNATRWYGSLGGFILKGSGWYRDGYGNKKPDISPSADVGSGE
jgi:putative FmdB family regulatory protein